VTTGLEARACRSSLESVCPLDAEGSPKVNLELTNSR
jgi:hypothetical protein